MPDRSLHRLESYQSGGTVGGDADDDANGGDSVSLRVANNGEENVGGTDDRRSSRNINGRARTLFAQFSLIGEASDDDDEEPLNEHHNGARWLRHWRRLICHRIYATAALLCFIILLFAYLTLVGKNGSHRTDGASAPTSTSDQNFMTCPVQSSYSVSSDIMELKNSSTGEYKHTCLYFNDYAKLYLLNALLVITLTIISLS